MRRPRSPLTTVGPVLVTVEPPRTPKLPAVPRGGAVPVSGAADALRKGLPVAGRSAAQINKTATKRMGLNMVATSCMKRAMDRLV